MTQVSRYPISKDVYERCWEIFINTLVGVKNSNDAKLLINDLLTPTEKVMMVKRLAIAMLLMQDYEYREITKLLKVSFGTIALVKLSLEHGSGGYKKAIDKILKDDKLKEILNKTAQALIAPATRGKGSGTWRYLKRELEKKSKDRKAF